MSDTIICPICSNDRVRIFYNGVILTRRITYTDEPKKWKDNLITYADLWKCDSCSTFFVDGYGFDFEELLKRNLD